MAVDHKQRKRLFKLKINGQFEGRTGRIRHEDIAGLPPSWPFTTHIGSPVTLRRPSLEEYVKLMHRSANIMYPKDIWALIGMLDIGPGSKVIEAGTGSGALTLHLSRAGDSECLYMSRVNIVYTKLYLISLNFYTSL